MAISKIPDMDEDPPTLASFLKLNSRPRPNNKNITPISAQIDTPSRSDTEGNNFTWGLTSNPAKM